MRVRPLFAALLLGAGLLAAPSPAAAAAAAPAPAARQARAADGERMIAGQFNMAGGNATHGIKGNEVPDALLREITSRVPQLAFLGINEGCLDWLERVEAGLPDYYAVRFDPIRGGSGAVTNCKHESPFGNAIIYHTGVLPDPQPVAHDLHAQEGAEKREMLCLRSAARMLVFCTAHLVPDGENAAQRQREAAEVKRVLASDYAGHTVLVGGDMNDLPVSAALNNLYHSGYGLQATGAFKEVLSPCVNLIQVYDPASGSLNYCRSGPSTHGPIPEKFDYLFVSPAVTVNSTTVLTSPHSDHKQIWADLSVPAASGPQVPRIMVVGDSISQGMEGDFTWRYRLAQHLAAAGRDVAFVGPYRGTTRTPRELPPDGSAPPPYFNGVYRDGLTFDSDHFAQWGRQAHQAMTDIAARVSTYQPDYLLVELGFNDLGWGVSTPDGLVADIGTLVRNARTARPGIRVLVATVPQRTPLDVQPDLGTRISTYNAKLAPALQALNTAAAPVRMVDITTGYDPYTDAYDGLHPNPRGEYKIAKAFANALWTGFQLGRAYVDPSSIPSALVPASPGWIRATPTPAGITLEWQHSFGAGGYWLYQRDVTNGGIPFERLPLQIPAETWKVSWVIPGHTYQYYVVAARGDVDAAAPSAVASATISNLETAAGPPNIRATAGPGYIDVSWDAATGPYSTTVRGYVVYYLDSSVPGSIVAGRQTSARSVRLTGLTSGHSYVLAVCSVNAAGEGLPAPGPLTTVT